MSDVAQAVTALFVPGDRPDRYTKAAAAGADVVIIDLEDAVAPAAKSAALAAVLAALAPDATEPTRALVRVNAAQTDTFSTEVDALLDLAHRAGHGLVGLMLPKAEEPNGLADLAQRLAGVSEPPLALVPLVESAAGLTRSGALAQAAGVTRLAFGALDFALDIDAEPVSPVADYARAQIVVASRAAGIAAPLNSPSVEIADSAAVAAAARRARAAGFGGQLCIHPAQLDAVRQAFAPAPADIAWARRVVEAGDTAVQIDGQMIDRPVLERARRILRRADGSLG